MYLLCFDEDRLLARGGGGGESLEWEAKKSKMKSDAQRVFFGNERGEGGLLF